MITIKELKEKMTEIEKTAIEQLMERSTLVPFAFVGNAIVVMNTKNEQEKIIKHAMLREVIKQRNADSVIMINLAWMSDNTNTNKNANYTDYTKPNFVMPSKNPNRKEVLLINGECVEGNISYAIEFTRKGRKITIGKKTNMCDGMTMKSPTGVFNFGISKVN